MSLEFNADKQIIKSTNGKIIGSNEFTIRSGSGSNEKEVMRIQLDANTNLPRVGINRTGRKIEKIKVNAGQGGSGYTLLPSILIGPPNLSDGIQALASAIITDGSVTAIIIDNPGDGYTSAPSVTISGGNGIGAAATAFLDTIDYELDINGAIRTSTSIISDTAKILNLDIDNFITPDAKFRAPSLKTFANNTGTLWVPNVAVSKDSYRYYNTNIYQALNTGVTGPSYPFHIDGTETNGAVQFKHVGFRVNDSNLKYFEQTGDSGIFPRSITPLLGDRSDKIATTEYVLNLATNDVGGRVYVSAQIGNDQNDGRSAVNPVRTIKRACQIASATVGVKETVVISGGEYSEDNPISIPPDCSVVGDALRIVLIRPNNPRKHMFKFADKNYISGITFRDKIDSNGDPIATWDFACVFDDKQRVYYDPTAGGDFGRNFPIGHQIFGPTRIRVPFQTNTGGTSLAANEYVTGLNTGAVGLVKAVNFTSGSSNINGSVDIEIVSGSFQTGETFNYPGEGGRPWAQNTPVVLNAVIYSGSSVYRVTTAGTTSSVAPSHTSGSATNGTATLLWLRSVYTFVATDVVSIRAEGEVTEHVKDLTTTLPITRIDGSQQANPAIDGVVFYTNPLIGRQNFHPFKENQEIEISGLPSSNPDLSMFNGKQRIYKIIRDDDGRARRFVLHKKPAAFTDVNYIPSLASVKSYSYYFTISLLNSPNKFDQTPYVSRRFQDACNLLRNNIDFIKDETYLQVVAEFPGFTNPNVTKCRRDIGHFVSAIIRDLEYGGNYNIVEAAKTYVSGTQIGYIGNEIAETVRAFDIARRLAIICMRNWRTGNGTTSDPIYTPLYSSVSRFFDSTVPTSTAGNPACADVKSAIDSLGYLFVNTITNNAANRYLDASYLIGRNAELIAEEASGYTRTQFPDLVYVGDSAEAYRYKDAANLIFLNKQEIKDRAFAEIALQYNEISWGNNWVTPGDTTTTNLSRYFDAYRLIQQNRNIIVETAYATVVASPPSPAPADLLAKCKRDIGYFVDAISLDIIAGGGNQYTRKFTQQYFSANTTLLTNGLAGEITQSITAFNKARDAIKSSITNTLAAFSGVVLSSPAGGTWVDGSSGTKTVYTDLTISSGPASYGGGGGNPEINSPAACADVRSAVDTLAAIVSTTLTAVNLSTLPAETTGLTTGSGEIKCKRDIGYIVTAIANDLLTGGNSNIITATKAYFNGNTPLSNGLVGETSQSVIAFNMARDMIKKALTNQLYAKDLTLTAGPASYGGTGGTITYTQSGNAATCVDVQNAVSTLTTIATTAITNGNLNALPTVSYGTWSINDKCKRDIKYILSGLRRDLSLGGNAGIVTAAESYFTGVALTSIPTSELAATRYAFQKVRDLAILAMRNWKTGSNGTGTVYETTYTNQQQYTDSSITIDASTPICNNVASAITTEFTLLDNILSSTIAPGATEKTYGTLYSPTITYPEGTLYDANNKRITPRALWDDLPIIEASPYIQNASVISFLGGGGCEIDGDKVAHPNSPFPGLELSGKASYPNQGKSMVAAQFTIVSFGGTGYKVVNDGYCQLVSVFVLFAADGVYADTGGYASVTNAATNFGIYALRARGYRKEEYSFDVATITNTTQSPTGKTVFTITGLGRRPLEHYVIKIDGYTNTNPDIEYFVDAVSAVTVGPPFTATITFNDTADFTKTSTGNPVSISNTEFVGKTLRLHRPSIVNSSGHTWEFSGSGTNYNALPENGGTKVEAYEQVSQAYGRVYTSGTDELGDFKVGYFARIENRTGAITFTGTVTISEVEFLKLKGGDVVVTGFDASNTLGGAFTTDSKLPTQKAVKDYITNNLGPYINKPYSTNAIPRALVELTDSGKISVDQIPALRPFSVYTVANEAARLALEGALAGDIAIQADTSTSYILNNDLSSLFAAFTVNTNLVFTAGNIFTGSGSGGKIQATEYRQGVVYKINITDGGSGYVTPPTVTISGGNPQAGAVSATATSTIANGVVVTITITENNGYFGGKGYTTQPVVNIGAPPGGGTQAVANALIESRLYGDIINQIKLVDADTITSNNSPTPTVVDISRVLNTSAKLSGNWVSLSTNQISADAITSGVISTSRLAGNSTEANSFTFLRGDQSYAPTLQSVKGTETRYFAILNAQVNPGSSTFLFPTNANILKGHGVVANVTGIPTGTLINSIITAGGTSTVQLNNPVTQTIPAGTVIEFTRPPSPLILDSSYTLGNFVDSVIIVSGGVGFTNGSYYDIGFTGGTGTGLRGNVIVSSGTVTSVVVTSGGANYNSDFNITTTPTGIGTGSGLVLAAKLATTNKFFGNTAIDVKRADDLTISSDPYGNAGIIRLQKSQFTIGAAGNGSVTLKTGADSGLDADLLDGAQGAYYLNASNLNAGTISNDRLSGTYNIGISGQSGSTLRLITSTNNPTSSPSPNSFSEGIIADTRNNTADSLLDGGSKHVTLTIRNYGSGFDATGGGVRQLAFTDNDNMWIRGSGTGVTSFGTWAKVWTSLNDGAGSGLDADLLANKQSLFYQNARNINDGIISQNRIPSYITSRNFNDSVSILSTTNKPYYDIYISGQVLTATPFLSGLTVNLYDASAQGTGTIIIGTVTTYTDPGGDTTLNYTIINGVLDTGTFISAKTIGTASNRVTFNDYTLSSNGTFSAAALISDSGIGRLKLGRKDGNASSPTIYFNSSATAATNYNSAIVASGGNGTDGSGSLNILVTSVDSVSINSNKIWNAGNITFASANTASAAVQRDSNGDFAARIITASLTGAASLNVLKTGDTMTGSLSITGTSSNLGVGGTSTLTGNVTIGAGSSLTVDTNTLFVDATNDRVGIKTITPSAAFEINNGAATISDGSPDNGYNGLIRITRATTNNQYINLVRQGTYAWSVGMLNGTSTLAIGQGQTTDSSFNATNSATLTVNTSGGVGIGVVAASTYALDVNGKGRFTTGLELDNAGDNSGTYVKFFGSSTGREFLIGNQFNVDDGFEITPSTTAAGSTFSTPSIAIKGSQTLAAPASTTITGAVGIRKIPNNNGSPAAAYALDISGNVNFDGSLYQNNAPFIASRWTAATNGTDIYRLSKVGINKADPSYTLDVSGNIGITGSLYMNGDRLFIDTYGIFRTNRNTIAENITLPSNTNAMSAGPITINSGIVINIPVGSAWSVI